jgi:pantetheine-phosphate adenylyltransferase
VLAFRGLLVDLAREQGCRAVLRGMRTASDFEYELQMALTNRAAGAIETFFLTPSPEYQFLNARLIRELGAMGGDVSAFLTPYVEQQLNAKFRKTSGERS